MSNARALKGEIPAGPAELAGRQGTDAGRNDLPPLAAIESVSKTYGLATVLDQVSFDIRAGEVHALVGENGAGKSTIAKCLAGFARPSGGRIVIQGETVEEFSVGEAERRGVVLIHQELALAEHLTVSANMFLGHEIRRGPILNQAEMNRQSSGMLRTLGCDVDVTQRVSRLSVSDRQMIEIGKALLRRARLLIMDEPTAVLTPREAEHLFAQIDSLRAKGVSIVFVSHKLDEVVRISDRVTVLRDGRYQGTWPTRDLTTHMIANLMVGRELSDIYPARRQAAPGDVMLNAEEFVGSTSKAPCSFAIRANEILGIAGLVGSGRTELFESLVGLRPFLAGKLTLRGKDFSPKSFGGALKAGVAYITEDRKGRGLLLESPVARNVAMLEEILSGRLLVDFAKEEGVLAWATREFQIDIPFAGVRVGRLSGGNQQKVLLAKSILAAPDVVIIDEPTRGIDVGTRAQIYRLLRGLADSGKAVVVISSDMQEVIGLSDRVLVMRDNRLAGELSGAEICEGSIIQLATGLEKIAGDMK